MKTLAFVTLSLATAGTLSFAMTGRAPVVLASKSCCESCEVAQYVPPSAAAVPASMLPGALRFQAALLGGGLLLGCAYLFGRRPAPARVHTIEPALS